MPLKQLARLCKCGESVLIATDMGHYSLRQKLPNTNTLNLHEARQLRIYEWRERERERGALHMSLPLIHPTLKPHLVVCLHHGPIAYWLLNSSWDHFGFHQGKNVTVTMKFEVYKRYTQRPTLSTDMVQRILCWERQMRCSDKDRTGPMVGKCCCNIFMMILFFVFYFGEKKMQTKEQSNLVFVFLNLPFGGIC